MPPVVELCSSHKVTQARVHFADDLLTGSNGITRHGVPPVALGLVRRAAGARLGPHTWGRLTQAALGQRLELKGRAIYRWERNETAPSDRHRRVLIREIHLFNKQAALELQEAFSERTGQRLLARE